jgi:exopolyphosphatase/guanosine-5'-triphosphate,3'-diphosphate pyrophosphatase
MGTVRLINNLVDDKMWDQIKDWIKNNTQKYSHITLLGTGGNINSTYKYSGKKIGTPLNYKYLIAYFNKVKAFSYDDRIVELDMNPDRADVIIPALKIYIFAMKWSGAECIYVPKVGLSDGIIRSLYNEKLNS